MPTTKQEYDAERIRILLDDLWDRTRREAGFVRIEQKSLPLPKVTGTATRAGLLRLGLDIARESQLPAVDSVTIDAEGWVSGNDGPVEILLADDNAFERPRPNMTYKVSCGVAIALIVSTLVLAVIGLGTVTTWVVNLAT